MAIRGTPEQGPIHLPLSPDVLGFDQRLVASGELVTNIARDNLRVALIERRIVGHDGILTRIAREGRWGVSEAKPTARGTDGRWDTGIHWRFQQEDFAGKLPYDRLEVFVDITPEMGIIVQGQELYEVNLGDAATAKGLQTDIEKVFATPQRRGAFDQSSNPYFGQGSAYRHRHTFLE